MKLTVTVRVDATAASRLVPASRSIRDTSPDAEPLSVPVTSRFGWRSLDQRIVLPLDSEARRQFERYTRWPVLRWARFVRPICLMALVALTVWVLTRDESNSPTLQFWIVSSTLALISMAAMFAVDRWAPGRIPRLVKGMVVMSGVHFLVFDEWRRLNPSLLTPPPPSWTAGAGRILRRGRPRHHPPG